ncbi:MAG: thermonuclease family protein [Betaproteobacteria bacterium]
MTVRLLDIDAPESNQAYGTAARQELLRLCPIGSIVTADGGKWDAFGRLIAKVTCARQDASSHQVRAGAAWVFRRYAHASSPLFALEADARASRRGLWAEPSPTPPWVWRRKPATVL